MQKKILDWFGWIVIYFVGLCFVCCLAMGIWVLWLLHSWTIVHKLTNTQQIVQMIPMEFPASSQVMDGIYIYSSTWYMLAKVKIPSSSLHQFISQPLLKDELRKQESTSFDYKNPEIEKRGWKLSTIKKYLATDYFYVHIKGQDDIPAQMAMKIDLDHSNYDIVYLEFIN
jgi:hypothetical protein